MWKSLLSSFTEDFNATIELQRAVKTKDSIWQDKEEFTFYATGIKCLLLRNKQVWYWHFTQDVEYIKTSHKLRMELLFDWKWDVKIAVDIQENDKVIDAVGREYEVKFVEQSPWFGGEPDHMLLFIDRIKNEWSNIGWS